MRVYTRLALAIVCAAILFGCRSVWVHPEATAEKYQEDTARCKYGMTSSELEEVINDPDRQMPRHRDDWRECMQLLGWTTETDYRSEPVWDRPWSPPTKPLQLTPHRPR